jgi:lipopolysaccharide/colanic/teichoic acid biosynthesis glycosyltransferase
MREGDAIGSHRGSGIIRSVLALGSPALTATHEIARSRAKRALDVVLAATGLAFSAPFVLLICAAIIADSGWPPLFAQERVGLLGARFRMWKFRTMRRGAETERASLLVRNEAPFPVFKLRDDPRVTRAGRLLRRASLDELPQLWNVLRGEMSLVGPRPPLPEEVAQYEASEFDRLAARPGLTGIWQIARRYRSDISFAEWVRMDLEYLERWSVAGDLRLILRTLRAIARLTGE